MIEFTAKIIKYILQYTSPADILSERVEYDNVSLDYLMRVCFAVENQNSETALDKKIRCLQDWVISVMRDKMFLSDRNEYEENSSGISFFGMISCLTSKVLTFREEELVYRYKYLEIWNDVSAQVGADLFLADRYALADMRQYRPSVVRKEFEWKLHPDHENHRLNSILRKGVSDNHFHLNGSLPYFELSWISLMNAVRQPQLIELLEKMQKNSRNIRKQYVTNQQEASYTILHLQAVLIRIYLYSVLTESDIQVEEYESSVKWAFQEIMNQEHPTQCLDEIGNQSTIPCEEIADELLRSDANATVRQWIERVYELNENRLFELGQKSPYFYSFFWIEYVKIPLSVIPVHQVMFCQENLEAIADYIEGHYGKVKLADYKQLYIGSNDLNYKKEWRSRTEQAVFHLLKNPDLLIAARSNIEGVLVGLQNLPDARYKDYMLSEVAPTRAESSSLYDMMGERYLLYAMFYLKHSAPNEEKQINRRNCLKLFFMYLVIKDRFRRELLYNNEKIGFRNFQQYNRRNTWFTTAFTQAELARISIRGAFESANLNSLEVRVVPSDSARRNIEVIQQFDREICRETQFQVEMKESVLDIRRVSDDPFEKEKYYYVFHFGKQQDNARFNRSCPKCRHEAYRKKIAEICRSNHEDEGWKTRRE